MHVCKPFFHLSADEFIEQVRLLDAEKSKYVKIEYPEHGKYVLNLAARVLSNSATEAERAEIATAFYLMEHLSLCSARLTEVIDKIPGNQDRETANDALWFLVGQAILGTGKLPPGSPVAEKFAASEALKRNRSKRWDRGDREAIAAAIDAVHPPGRDVKHPFSKAKLDKINEKLPPNLKLDVNAVGRYLKDRDQLTAKNQPKPSLAVS